MKRNASAIILVSSLFLLLIGLNFVFFVDRSDAEENELSADRSSYRSTPYGTLAFYTLLAESQYDVTRLEKPFTELKDHEPGTLVVITPPDVHNPDEEEFAALDKWIEAGGLLIIVDRDINKQIGDAGIHTEYASAKSPIRILQPSSLTRGVQAVAVSDYASRVKVNSRAATYHVGDDQAAVVADAQIGKG